MDTLSDTDVPCIECANLLPKSANKCAKCGSLQVGWKNNLKSFAAIVGGVSVVAAALSFIIGTWNNTRKVIAWHDELVVISLNITLQAKLADKTTYNIKVVNAGDGDVVLIGLDFYSKKNQKGRTAYIPISETIQPQKVAALKNKGYESSSDLPSATLGENVFGGCNVPIERFNAEDSCFSLNIFTPNDPGFLHMDERHKFYGNPLCKVDADADIKAFSVESKKMFTTSIPVTMTLLYDVKNPSCKPPVKDN